MSILAGEEFELKLLPSDAVSLHEECEDNRYSRLMERFTDEKVLYNPLIVARLKEKYILIDGANRFEALRRIGCKAILAQLVDYSSEKVKLKSWYHFVSEMKLSDLLLFAEENKLKVEKVNGSRKPALKNELIVCSSGGECVAIMLPLELEKMLEVLSKLNRYYEVNFSYVRIDSDTDISDVSRLSPEDGLLFVFPEFSKDDITEISSFRQKLPAGISRHMIPNRILHIKFLIDALASDEHLDKKNDELEKYVQHKIDTKKVRLYREPILIFDE